MPQSTTRSFKVAFQRNNAAGRRDRMRRVAIVLQALLRELEG